MKVIIPNKLNLLSCSIAESDAIDGPEWQAETAYAEGAKVRRKHVSYVSLAKDNKGNDPAETWSGTDAKWKKGAATQPWKMLDDYVETQTSSQPGQILSFSVNYDFADAFALLNLAGMEISISIIDPEDNSIIWSLEQSLLADILNLSLYEYNYFPLVDHDRVAFADNLPMLAKGILKVDIKPSGDDLSASVGHVIVGRQHELGYTEYDAEIGFTDYSRKTVDEFGVTTFVRRSCADNLSLPVYLHPDRMDYVAQTLRGVRGMPALWIGDNRDGGKECLTQWGWLEDFRQVYSGPNETRLSLEIQGLI